MLPTKGSCATLAALLVASLPAVAQSAEIADIRVQLFYERSGTLSTDLTKERGVALWNTIIGAGDLKEPANDVLVSIVVNGGTQTYDPKANLTVSVFDDGKNRRIAERRFAGLLFKENGQVVKPLFLAGRTCTPLRIVARIGRSSKMVTVPFRCGE